MDENLIRVVQIRLYRQKIDLLKFHIFFILLYRKEEKKHLFGEKEGLLLLPLRK